MTFNGTDLGDYGLIVTAHDVPFPQQADPTQLQDMARASESYRLPKDINLEVAVLARPPFPPLPMTPQEALKIQLDSIRRVLNQRSDCQLIFDRWSDRYWLARFVYLGGEFTPTAYTGSLSLVANDPAAYGVIQRTESFNVDADPKTLSVVVAFGNDYIYPVWTLTAGENLVGATIQIENTDTSEELVWTGDIANTEVLDIDVANWLVELEGAASMGGVSGKFPRLLPSQLNSITVTGFGSLGTLDVAYRERFL